ncbi:MULTISPECIES: hypothetical protein [Halomonadaceae]|uniref:hypothetical protein n=1 Tax=Halomonadaceae TaxID=28256 RepID=UPI0004E38CF0|nr:hypothetical protein [Halomonas sp. KO116]AJY52086.1 hypothetical protein KO116_03619 [Halomonas sp. KO116]|tara:strand:+ start:5068 stop:5241 length:174 start_codon:yes stop_codon:yes gene_type:complete
MSKWNKEEQDILDAFDAGELQRATDVEDRNAKHQQYAEAMLKKDASILHKYVEGRLH